MFTPLTEKIDLGNGTDIQFATGVWADDEVAVRYRWTTEEGHVVDGRAAETIPLYIVTSILEEAIKHGLIHLTADDLVNVAS